ncbi:MULTISPECIES: hypothetical protein [unclassified Minwuia]|jgi:hypothetical protein|uniref:hypothetical protein n=1 Tax=unclassified Minwuia TaxID=2618799 RepID=UPI0024797467|nr:MULTISPECIES: hypothetical protein [unclassified Minwuia]MDF1730095.1 hypothetical protein [Minwuia sp.]
MYYLLIAAAAGLSIPADNAPISKVDVFTAPSSELTAYDTRRIQYKARNWEAELKSDVDVYFGTFDSMEACKAVRAQIRTELSDKGLEEDKRSGCFESKQIVASR